MELTRRSLIAGSAAVAATGVSGASLARADETSTSFATPIPWDVDYDVVVIGYGAAGCTAAITAADDGAKVLLVEKAPWGREGGDTIFSGQCCMGVEAEHVDDLVTYFTSMCDRYTNYDPECFQVMAEGCAENFDWLVSLGADPEPLTQNAGETGWRGKGSGYYWNENPHLEGSGFNISWVVDGNESVSPLYWLLHDNVEARDNIDVWYEAPAKHLIQDPATKTIYGVQVEKDGAPINILARNGVVMALGGFENNNTMIGDYLQRPYAYVFAGKYNEGDGVKMAIEAGADLWHMSNSAGFIWSYKNDNMECSIYPFTVKNGILVGPGGTRFMNEAYTNKHGRIDIGGRMIQTPYPNPTYMICDADALASKSLHAAWSEGNVKEVEKGWIGEAATIAELAEAIGVYPEKLQETVDSYNAAYDAGENADFGRPYDTIVPIKKAPFYYVEVGPTMYNTQGGARRNKNAEVIDIAGNPIPHLYSAGDFGAIWPDMYNGSGNLGECVVFGRIAGHGAAAAKDDVDLEGVQVAGSKVDAGIPTFETGENEYIGMGRGKGGQVVVKVTMDGDTITDIALLQLNETVGLCDYAIAEIPAAIIDAQSTEVDVCTGATRTSNAIKEAVADALAQIG